MIFDVARSEAAYRLTFAEMAILAPHEIAIRVADIIATFPGIVELRISCERPHYGAIVYVMIPADVMPESLDVKAQALRAKWEAEAKK